MRRATNSPFSSDYGFSSPSFSVDENGNIIANSITVVEGGDSGVIVNDFLLTNDESKNILIQDYLGIFPTLTLSRSRTYLFELNLDLTGLLIFEEDQSTFYTQNLRHSSGDSGAAAQSKRSGILSITIPSTFSQDTIYYTNDDRSQYGIINVIDPLGSFGTVNVTGGVLSTSPTTGSLIVDGGAGIQGDVFIDGSLNLNGIGIPKISSSTNLELNADNKILLQINDALIGNINSSGLEIPINNSNIGLVTPAAAAFTQATVETTGSVLTSITNKQYVDTNSIAFAIALGI